MTEQGNSRQLEWRADHSIVVLQSNVVATWGGDQDGLPRVHDDEEKRTVTGQVHVLNLPSMEWSHFSTTGTPPAGAMTYGATTIGDDIYVFDGGICSYDDRCVHNSLYEFNSINKVWRCVPCHGTNRPMQKKGSGFISYSHQGQDGYLLVLGGEGEKHPPALPQISSSYIRSCDGDYYTNEVHIMNVKTSPGQWISPTNTGSRPLAISHFSLNMLPHSGNQAVMFGGYTFPEEWKEWECSNEAYHLTMTNDTVHFTKLSLAGPPGPVPRASHASTIISTGTQDHLLVMGGGNDPLDAQPDCWILDPASKRWSEVRLPESVCGRYSHCVCSVTRPNTNTVWIIVTGGMGMDRCPVRGDEVAMVVELVYGNDNQWREQGVWNTTENVFKCV